MSNTTFSTTECMPSLKESGWLPGQFESETVLVTLANGKDALAWFNSETGWEYWKNEYEYNDVKFWRYLTPEEKVKFAINE